jgi:hypothetical protein
MFKPIASFGPNRHFVIESHYTSSYPGSITVLKLLPGNTDSIWLTDVCGTSKSVMSRAHTAAMPLA